MRKTITIALGTAAALITAAVAFAVIPAVVGVNVAKATFETTTIEKSKVRSCTADAMTWESTDARYKGTVGSTNLLLAGSLAIHAKTIYNTTQKLGYVDGSFQINDADSRVKGKFSGTISDGKLVGYLTGKSRGNHAKVYGNLSADFAGGATNFANGQIGSDSSKSPLAVVAGRVCKMPKPEHEKKAEKPKKAKHVEAKGEITALSGDSITVTGKKGPVTCKIDGSPAVPSGVGVGTKNVEIKCEEVGAPAEWTLRKLELGS